MKKLMLMACTGLLLFVAACGQNPTESTTTAPAAESLTEAAAQAPETDTEVPKTQDERHRIQGVLVSLGMSRMVMETTAGEELEFYIVGADKTFVMEPQPGVEIEVLYSGEEITNGDTSNVKVISIDEIWENK